MDTQLKLRKIFLLVMALVLLSSCSGISGNNLPSLNAPAVINQLSSSPGAKTLQPTTGVKTQGAPQLPLATATHRATHTPTVAPTQAASPTPAVTATPEISPTSSTESNIKTVFVIVMENHNWSDIQNSSSAPYINQTLLPQASYATQYFNPPGNHPSEPNYLWLEAGKSFGIKNDEPPASNHLSTTNHLVTLLDKAGVSWKAYSEGISGKNCPLTGGPKYTPHHNPVLYFDNVTDNNNPNSKYCIDHVRPFTELKSDLLNNKVSGYNFITPNMCDNMHDTDGCPNQDPIKNGDTWLSEQIPMIMKSQAYTQGGAIFILWDESENGDNPIGMILLSPFAKGGGYSNDIPYTHSSTLRTIEEIFGITPLLGDAAKATDLSDLFSKFP